MITLGLIFKDILENNLNYQLKALNIGNNQKTVVSDDGTNQMQLMLYLS